MTMDIKSLLKIWQRHFDQDVSPQAAGKHLALDIIRGLAQKDGVADAQEEVLKHLSTCPVCFSAWAKLCREEEVEELDENVYAPLMFFGAHAEEDDVFGQAHSDVFPSSCGNFQLELTAVNDSSKSQLLSFIPKNNQFLGNEVRVRDRNGSVLLSGVLTSAGLTVTIPDAVTFDLSYWTVTSQPAAAE